MRSLVTQSFRMILHICSTELHSTELSSLSGTSVKEYLRKRGHGKDRGRGGGVRPRDCGKVGIPKYYNSCRVGNKESWSPCFSCMENQFRWMGGWCEGGQPLIGVKSTGTCAAKNCSTYFASLCSQDLKCFPHQKGCRGTASSATSWVQGDLLLFWQVVGIIFNRVYEVW